MADKKINGYMVAAGMYHDIDHARLELLELFVQIQLFFRAQSVDVRLDVLKSALEGFAFAHWSPQLAPHAHLL